MNQEVAILDRPFTKAEKQDALKTSKEVNDLLSTIEKQETSLAMNFAKLGNLLLKIRSKKYWLLWEGPQDILGMGTIEVAPFQSFGAYIASLKDRVDKGRTQLYQLISVAEKLLPTVGEQNLIDMGITKALELKRFVTNTGRNPTKELVAKAIDPDISVDELRAEIFQKTNPKGVYQGTYYDLGGCYLTSEEKGVVLKAFDLARKVDPIIKQDIPVHIQKKEILLRMCEEAISQWGPEVRRK